jgi:thiol-disulfide isomerase/thioredoxin
MATSAYRIFTRKDILAICLIAISVITLPMLIVEIRGRVLSEKTIPAINGPIKEQIEKGGKVLLYLYTPGCAGCSVAAPIIDSLGVLYPHSVFKINLAQNPEITELFKVPGVPFFVLIDHQRIIDIVLGIRELRKICSFFE